MTNGSTWNSIDTPMRRYFVERKMIECVISLPVKMFPYTNIGTTLIVFSHGNDTIRMIDATEIYHKGRRQNMFLQDDIATILTALHTDSEYSKDVTLDELRANEYNLSLVMRESALSAPPLPDAAETLCSVCAETGEVIPPRHQTAAP